MSAHRHYKQTLQTRLLNDHSCYFRTQNEYQKLLMFALFTTGTCLPGAISHHD